MLILFVWVCAIFCITAGVLYQLVCYWYWQQVQQAQAQVHDQAGKGAPGKTPKPIVGNLSDIYRARNRLHAYNALHHQFGNVVQILWLWRYQISVASYPIARYVLGDNQYSYEKFPPNALIRRLYGASVLSNNGAQWKRHRLILNELFTEKAAVEHHATIVQTTQKLIEQWQETLSKAQTERSEIESKTTAKQQAVPDRAHIDLCQNFSALFLNIITQITVGRSVDASETGADSLLENFACITKASTQPQHQFVRWWRFVPLPQNYRLAQALTEIDDFFEKLIAQNGLRQHPSAESKRAVLSTAISPKTVLDKLLQASSNSADFPLSHEELKVRA